MKKSRVLIIIVILVVVGAIIIIQQQQSINQVEQMEAQALEDIRRVEIEKKRLQVVHAEKEKQLALEAARKAEAEAQRVKQQALEGARRIEEAAKNKVEELKAKVNQLVVQAQSLLDSGKFQDAINAAQSILSLDANNVSAKSIIDQAKAKLQEAVQQQAETLKQGAQEVLEGLGATVPVPDPGQ